MDLDRGAIVFTGDGKGEKSLEPFLKRLRHSRAKFAAVAASLSGVQRRDLPEPARGQPAKRPHEMLCFHIPGWVTKDEVEARLAKPKLADEQASQTR